MQRLSFITIACLIVLCAAAKPAVAGGEASPAPLGSRLSRIIGNASTDGVVPVWIFLDAAPSSAPEWRVSGRAGRRVLARGAPAVRRHRPIAIDERIVASLRPHLVRIRHRSRYFHAVSADVRVSAIESLRRIHGVRFLEAVAEAKRPLPGVRLRPDLAGDPVSTDLGESAAQLEQLNLPPLLAAGRDGSGRSTGNEPVIVCVMDSGFDLDHEAFRTIRIDAERDFVEDDGVTVDDPGDSLDQDWHGTSVLGVIAGNLEGRIAGPAAGAAYLLAKTEIIGSETRIEEDNWIAGLEWADSAGADVVTSSLGYYQWYGPEDLDGETALCTRAADIAASRGVVVVQAAGNFGSWGGLIAPADGDSVITVGSVDRHGVIAWSSSRGPTADGRIKPDVVARGVEVFTVDGKTAFGYNRPGGTSFATPLVAGICVLMLEESPERGPIDIRDRLRASGNRAASPDTVYGWGIPDAVRAVGAGLPETPAETIIARGSPNPFREEIAFEFFLPRSEPLTAHVYDVAGRLVRILGDARIVSWSGRVTWDGRNDRGEVVASGVYFIDLRTPTLRRTMKTIRVR